MLPIISNVLANSFNESIICLIFSILVGVILSIEEKITPKSKIVFCKFSKSFLPIKPAATMAPNKASIAFSISFNGLINSSNLLSTAISNTAITCPICPSVVNSLIILAILSNDAVSILFTSSSLLPNSSKLILI